MSDRKYAALSIRRRLSGKWEARYRDSAGRQRSKSFVRKVDAVAFLTGIKTDMHRGMWVDPSGSATRFESCAREWLGNKLNLRPASFACDECYLRNHILPEFGEAQLGRITRAHVQTWVKELLEKGLAPATVRACCRILNSVLNEAVEARLITESPYRRISLPRIPYREQLYLSAEEVERLVEAMNPLHRPLVYAAVYLGCRWGELVGLRREHLDLARRRVRVVGTLEEVRGRPTYVEETKTETSRRMLSMPPFLAEMIAEHLRSIRKNEFVFIGRDGGLLRRSPFRQRHWNPALERAGLDPALRFHDLRHTCAALLKAAELQLIQHSTSSANA